MPRSFRHFRDSLQPPQDASQNRTADATRSSIAASMMGFCLSGTTFSEGGLSRFFSTFRKHPDAKNATPTRHAPRHGVGESAATAALVHAAKLTLRDLNVNGFAVAETGRV